MKFRADVSLLHCSGRDLDLALFNAVIMVGLGPDPRRYRRLCLGATFLIQITRHVHQAALHPCTSGVILSLPSLILRYFYRSLHFADGTLAWRFFGVKQGGVGGGMNFRHIRPAGYCFVCHGHASETLHGFSWALLHFASVVSP